MSTGWLLDNSAWARLDDEALHDARRDEVARLLAAGQLHTCLPFLLEAGVSARSPHDWALLAADLAALPEVPIDAVVEAQRDLVRAGLHRAIPIVDLLLATLAERHHLTLLHYDHDFDRLHESTALRFTSEWLSAAGTL